VLSTGTMQAVQTEEELRQQARVAENAASAAQVEAEEALQRLVQTHRPGSPTVDDAVTELALRRDEYRDACRASERADAAYHEELLHETLRERRRRRTDHNERIQTARRPIGAASLQSEADIDDKEGSSGDDSSGDDLLPPASKKQKATQQAHDAAARDSLSAESANEDSSDDERKNDDSSDSSDDERKNDDSSEGERGDSGNTPTNVGLLPGTSSSQPRTLNRLVARAMENLAARAAAATPVARIQEARGDKNDAGEVSDDNNASGVSSEDSAISSEQAESPPMSEYVPSDSNESV
jgi:hypothetical protein